ncbi:MAG: potassium channel family protein [Syntrophales bacterium]
MNSLLRIMETSKFHYLLASLALMIALYPFVEGIGFAEHLYSIFIMAIFFSSLYMLDRSPRLRRIAYFNGGLMLIMVALSGFFKFIPPAFEIAGAFATLCFLILIAFAVIFDIFHSQNVTADTISGAACLYLLIGIIWGEAYSLLEHLYPGSFYYSLSEKTGHRISSSFFTYFSFVTLTTIGYGDISPVSKGAKLLVIMEAIMGQLYIAIFLARIIATYQGRKKTAPPKKE